MHVALLSPSWPLQQHANGIVTYVHFLREALRREGHRVSVFSGRVAPEVTQGDVHRVEPTPAWRLRRRVRRLLGAADPGPIGWGSLLAERLLEVHRRDPIDVVEMEESFGWCAEVRRRLPVPVVVKLHCPAFLSLFEPQGAQSPETRDRIEAEARALAAMPVVTSPSHATLDRTVATLGLAPAISVVVPNPMTVSDDVGTWRAATCEPDTVLFVGRFDWCKGGDTMLLAFCALLARRPGARLVFVGPDFGLQDDGALVHFEAWCARHLAPAQRARVEWRGSMPREEIFGLRLRAAVTVVASRWDNQPNTVLEAMLQACPVVALRAGGIGELIEHGRTGRLAPAEDVAELAAQIDAVLADLPAAQRLGAAAREAVRQRHGPDTVAAQTVAVYRQALALRAATAGIPRRAQPLAVAADDAKGRTP